MSLLVDPDYAIYALRLAYLRRIDDHAGPRVISFPSISNLPPRDQVAFNRTAVASSSSDLYGEHEDDISLSLSPGRGFGIDSSVLSPLPSDSHVVIAGLNDARYQPELATLHSPKLNTLFAPSQDSRLDPFGGFSREDGKPRSLSQSDSAGDGTNRAKNSGGLKYTSTIFGPGRTGALGMRVSGRRATSSGEGVRRPRGVSRDGSLAEEESGEEKSGISAMLSQHSKNTNNEFAAMYKNVAGGSTSDGANTTVEVYFPFASSVPEDKESRSGANAVHPKKKSMSVTVRKDATMEELIGYSLYCYVEDNWMPRLEHGLSEGASEEEREIRMSTLGWTLRIVEDEEVDDDFPAIDRSLLVGKFGADELAVCEATPSQVKQHQSAMPKIQRRSSQQKQPVQTQQLRQSTLPQSPLHPDTSTQQTITPVGPSARLAATAGNITAGSLVNLGGTPIFASSALSKSAMSPMATSIFLRVLITPNSEVKYKTTLQVPSDMYLADVLETICRKRQLADVDQWALVVPEKNIVVPLDRTVESLQGNHDLALVKRQDLGDQAGVGALTGQSTNPNASIFKRLSEPAHLSTYRAGKEIASTYKSYVVNRKQASFLGRHERTLTIDGDWIHIIPTDTRAFQAQSHTTSFPISVIVSCYQSRLPTSFKLIVARESDQKRYEFEAETSKVAAEIVEEINSLIKRTK